MNLRGHPLNNEAFEKGHVLKVAWDPKVSYHWDSGVAIGRYLEGLKRGHLTGVVCDHCKRTVIPPRLFCEVCFHPMSRFVKLPDTGVVNTYSVTYVRWDRVRMEAPIIPAVIDIDGTDPRVGILHLLGEIDLSRGSRRPLHGQSPMEPPPQRPFGAADFVQEIKIGMKVKAVWKTEEEREGSILDLRYFKPI